MRIDTHAHIFSIHNQFIANARYTPDYDALVEKFIDHLDHYHFTHGLLVQPSFLGTDNQFMLDAIAKYPHRLEGIAVVEPSIALENLKALKSQGVIGIRLNLFGLKIPDFNQPEWLNFLTYLEQLKLHIELHAPPSYLVEILPQLHLYNIDLAIDHFGRIDPKLGIEDANYQLFLELIDPHKDWIKISGYYRLGASPENIETAKKAYALLKDKSMYQKMLWGSDWPHTQHETIMSYQQSVEDFSLIVVDQLERETILCENAQKFYQMADS